MKKFLITTTINPPTEAVTLLATLPEWHRIVIGDKKTPADWNLASTTYFGPTTQESLPYALITHLPWNTPARAMVGFLEAMRQGADSITQIDDDNIPYPRFAIPAFDGSYTQLSNSPFVNMYRHFGATDIWPRGYPLPLVTAEDASTEKTEQTRVGVWQHLADQDTDVDAIFRLTKNKLVTFSQREPITLAPGTWCPFNCQSTTFRKEVFPLLYLPAFVHPRVSDIMRSFVAQPILNNLGYTLGFTSPLVRQERNPHEYLKDFEAEMPIYLYAQDMVQTAAAAAQPGLSAKEQMVAVYTAFVEKKFVPPEELTLLNAWIADISKFS